MAIDKSQAYKDVMKLEYGIRLRNPYGVKPVTDDQVVRELKHYLDSHKQKPQEFKDALQQRIKEVQEVVKSNDLIKHHLVEEKNSYKPKP